MKKKNKIALITGVTGQDGSYLAEFLLKRQELCSPWDSRRRAQAHLTPKSN